MSLDLVYRLHCDECDESPAETFNTALEAESWANDNDWATGPGDGYALCVDCADKAEDAAE
jgi:hypothetical protein